MSAGASEQGQSRGDRKARAGGEGPEQGGEAQRRSLRALAAAHLDGPTFRVDIGDQNFKPADPRAQVDLRHVALAQHEVLRELHRRKRAHMFPQIPRRLFEGVQPAPLGPSE